MADKQEPKEIFLPKFGGPGPVTGSGTSAGGYYFFENFFEGTYYVRKGDVFVDDDEKHKPKSLDPANYDGPAVFYAYYDKDSKKVHAIDYLKKTKTVHEPATEYTGVTPVRDTVLPLLPFTVEKLREEEEKQKQGQ